MSAHRGATVHAGEMHEEATTPDDQRGEPGAEETATAGYPIVIQLAGQRALVVGGGPVATRRAEGLVRANAEVTVVSPQVTDTLRALAESQTVTWEARHYQRGEARSYSFVITATGNGDVDDEVLTDCRVAGVLANCADSGHPGTVQVPATVHRGPVTVAISTNGASPAVAAWIKVQVETAVGPEVEALVHLADEARTMLTRAGRPTSAIAWAPLFDDTLVPLLRAGRREEARAALEAAVFDALVAPPT